MIRMNYTKIVRENWLQVQPMQYILIIRQIENEFQSTRPDTIFTDIIGDIAHKFVNLMHD
jgi:hypothetical protein